MQLKDIPLLCGSQHAGAALLSKRDELFNLRSDTGNSETSAVCDLDHCFFWATDSSARLRQQFGDSRLFHGEHPSVACKQMQKDKVFRLAKGFRGRSKNCLRLAKERVEKALQYAYRDRRQKKRDMRSLWIQRINAGTKQHGVSLRCSVATQPKQRRTSHKLLSLVQVSYSTFIHGLKEENIQVNRKVLSELAMQEPYSFKSLVDQVKFMLGEKH